MTITIDRTIFDSAKAHGSLQVAALEASEKVEEITQRILEVANQSFEHESQTSSFQIMPLNFGSGQSDSVHDFAIIHQKVDKDGKVSGGALMDLSFAVTNTPQGDMIPGVILRMNSRLNPPDKPGEPPVFQRHPAVDSFIPAADADDFANKLFLWVFKNMPEDRHDHFLKNCEAAGLVSEPKGKIGFDVTDANDEPQSPKSPSSNTGFIKRPHIDEPPASPSIH